MLVAYIPESVPFVAVAPFSPYKVHRKVLWSSPRIIVECIRNAEAVSVDDLYKYGSEYTNWTIDKVIGGDNGQSTVHARHTVVGGEFIRARVPIPMHITFTCGGCGNTMHIAQGYTFCPKCDFHPDDTIVVDNILQWDCNDCQMQETSDYVRACPVDIPF